MRLFPGGWNVKLSSRLFAMIGLAVAAVAVTGQAQAQAPAKATKPPVMTHEAAGREQCMMCHGGAMEGIKAAPADHKGRGNETCLWCHAKDAEVQTNAVPNIPHDTAGREQCAMCHSGAMEGIKAMPASHKGRDVKTCTMCHTVAKK
jgi:hypothetical protein